MFKKLLLTAVLTAASAMLFAAGGMKTFKIAQNTHAVKAGTIITTEVEFESDPGYVLAGWSAVIIRKNAPPEFFSKPEVKVRKHSHPDYCSVLFSGYLHFPVAQTKGKFPVRINTAGMSVGDYAVSLQGRWMKDGKSYYPGDSLFISITEADNGKFAETAQEIPDEFQPPRKAEPTPDWCKSIKVTPNPIKVKAGEKIAFTCDYTAKDGEFYGGYLLMVLRKYVPKAFFELNSAKVRKNKSSADYDGITIKPFIHSANLPATQLKFELDTTGYPVGRYTVHLQFRVVKADGKTSYPSYPIALTITK